MKFFFASCFLFLSFMPDVCGQGLDSLEQKLNNENLKVAERIEVLNVASRIYLFTNPARTMELAKEALSLSLEADNITGAGYAYRNLASAHAFIENYSSSLEYAQRALDIFRSTKDSIGIASCYISLGHAHRYLQDREEEIFYHKKSYEIFSRMKMVERIGVTVHNLGESYYNNGEFDKARALTLLAIHINDSIKNLSVLSSCYKVMGFLEFSQKNHAQAEAWFSKVLKISAALGEGSQKVATMEALLHLAQINKLKGRPALQFGFLTDAAALAKKYHLPRYPIIIYTELISYFAVANNQAEVLRYVAEYKVVSDSINSRKIKELSELAKNVVQVHLLERDKTMLEKSAMEQAQKLQARNVILIIVLVSSLLLSLFIIKLFRANIKVTVANKALQAQNETIATQRSALEELNRVKDKFFSIVSHDLRSPLSSLLSFSQLMIDHLDHLSKADIVKMSHELNTSVTSTIKLADNLIAWAQVQMKEDHAQMENISIPEIISNIVAVYQGNANENGISINSQVADELSVYGDKNQISFVIRNLVNNAVKYTPQGGAVNIAAGVLPNGKVKISVSDTGIGIAEELKKTIFSLGRKSSLKGTNGEKGTGLGLMLSYEFIKLHKGTIEVESAEGKGSSFSIMLPTAQGHL